MKTLFATIFLLGLTPEAPFDPLDRSNPEYAETSYQYRDCVVLLKTDPEAARQLASEWMTTGGGAPSLHCLALADLARGYPKLAALRLMELSERSDAGDMLMRARILEQSALAWLEAENPTYASDIIEEAKKIAPNAGQISLTAGIIYAAHEKWQNAVDEITAAEEVGISSVDGFVARARAYLSLSKNRQSAEDVISALQIDPLNVDALVLRGELTQQGVEIDANYKRAPTK